MTLCFGWPRRIAAGLLFFLCFLGAVRARAAEPIALAIHGDPLPEDRLREAVAHELGAAVMLGERSDGGVLTITWRRSAGELAVTWDGPKHGTVSRVIAARPKVDDVIADAAILAGNLARDEVAEMVPETPPATVPAPSAPPTPEPEPVVAPPKPTAPPPKADAPKRDDFEEANASILYPIAANIGRPWLRTRIDVNLFSSRLGELEGLELGGLNLVLKTDRSTGDVSGVQIGWLANVATGKVTGLQSSFVANYADRSPAAWQLAFCANYTHREFTGVQSSFVLNVAGRSEALQLASINVSEDLHGGQVGFVDVTRDLSGVQIGFVNVARHAQGAMIGLVNVADDVDGVPVGLVSVSRTGGVHPEAWSSLTTFANVGLKLATKYTYTMPTGHYTHAYDKDFYGAGFVVGGRIPIDERPHVDVDLGFDWLYAPERTRPEGIASYHEQLLHTKLRGLFGWSFSRHFGVYAGLGATLQVRLERNGDQATFRVGPDVFAGIEL